MDFIMIGKWTVILRTQGKNNELELKNALNSLVAQTYENLSVILTIHTDNNKTAKDTLEFIKPFQKMVEISPIIIKEKQGNRSHPLNVALKSLNSDFVSFLDNDDIYYPHMGKILIEEIKNRKVPFAYGISVKVLEREQEDSFGNKYLYTTNKSIFERRNFNMISFQMDNYIPFNSFIIETSFLENLEFDEELDFLEDWDFLRKLALKKNFSISKVETPVSEYRLRNDSTDTFNEENYHKWITSVERSDNNIKNRVVLLSLKEVLDFKKEYQDKINSLTTEIDKINMNPAYRLWVSLRENPVIKKTIGALIRKFRSN